jgi:hypothetical protein
MDGAILGGRRRDGEVLMLTLNRIQDDLALGVCIYQLEAIVGVRGRANVETLLCMEILGTSSGWLCMDEDATTNWAEQHLIEVEGTLEKFPCTDLGLSNNCQSRLRVSLACGRRRSQR